MCSSNFISQICAFVLIGITFSHASLPEEVPPPPATGSITSQCEHYSVDCEADGSCGPNNCTDVESDKTNHCITLWTSDNATGEYSVGFKGCFISTSPCTNASNCVRKSNNMLLCCCEGNMCNANRMFPGLPPAPAAPAERDDTRTVLVTNTPPDDDSQLSVLAYSLAAVFVLTIALLASYLVWRHRKSNLFNELPTAEPSLSCPPSPAADDAALPVVLREVRARGRFGAVWRAHLHDKEVAVKVFPLQDKQSWLCEQQIYQLPRMRQPDILHYIAVQKQGDNLQAEYWLITAYHEKGSLCDYLKAHTLTWGEAWRVAGSVARGLTHLHDELAAGPGGGYKPAVAHRDFKSKNVLLKSDMSACIADFGLALIFQPGKPCGDTHGQVGTRRYMAPEVLEGAINFTKDAFLRIDMYACGLVLWEIVSRCVERGEPMSEYRLPLEEQVGSHPSLEEMQDAVVLRKLRPIISPLWRLHPGVSVLCDTMEECWDHDAEARLSASCVLERIGTHAHNNNSHALLIEDAALLPLKETLYAAQPPADM